MRNGPGRKSRTKSCGRFPPMLYGSHIFKKKEGEHGGRKINFGKIQNFFGKGVTNRGSGTLYRVEGVGVRRWRPIPRGRWPSSDPAFAGPPSPSGKALFTRYKLAVLYLLTISHTAHPPDKARRRGRSLRRVCGPGRRGYPPSPPAGGCRGRPLRGSRPGCGPCGRGSRCPRR